jgi:hypothetical protein
MVRVRQVIGSVCALACAAAALFGSASALAHGGGRDVPVGAPSSASGYSAMLERCLTSATEADRSVTFVAQMTAVPGTARVSIRVELQQRLDGEVSFHTLIAPGLGLWRGSEPGVTIYKYVKQITNLAAPAGYRAVVHFRWIGDRGRLLKRAVLHTASCEQPLLEQLAR